MSAETWLTDIFAQAGLTPNGARNYDPQIVNPEFYERVRWAGSLGLGESYMDGWWHCERLDEFFHRLLRSRADEQAKWSWPAVAGAVWSRVLNLQSVRRAFQVGEAHYDIGNELFAAMLGQRLVYSCGYWRNACDLDQAQEHKLDLVCRKLGLRPGQRVLDVGCGWGEMLKFAADRYGVSGVGITVSKQQAAYAQRLCRDLPIEIRLQDYRSVNERFDAIISVGMFEHVGSRNYRTFMEMAGRCLAPDGLMLLHTIGNLKPVAGTDPWIAKYIFPNGQLPCARQITRAVEDRLVIEDWHNFGADYDRTLMAWARNFEAAWPSLSFEYSDRFWRMWRYYLLSCAGSFRARHIQLWQIVLSPHGIPGGYVSVR